MLAGGLFGRGAGIEPAPTCPVLPFLDSEILRCGSYLGRHSTTGTTTRRNYGPKRSSKASETCARISDVTCEYRSAEMPMLTWPSASEMMRRVTRWRRPSVAKVWPA